MSSRRIRTPLLAEVRSGAKVRLKYLPTWKKSESTEILFEDSMDMGPVKCLPNINYLDRRHGFCLFSGVVTGQHNDKWRSCAAVLWCFMIASTLLTSVAANRPPRFLLGDAQTEIVIRLKEGPDTPAGSLIYRLRAVDADGDVLKFGIRDQVGSDVLRIQTISSNEANIYLAKELDREIRDEYAFVLTLSDGHLGDGNYITQSFLLLVEDVNDNEPIFKPYPTAISVKEDATPSIVTTVEATDLDEGAYGQVVYHLQELDGDEDAFSIQTVNGKGVVRLTSRLDYERKSLYQLRILAVDRANQGRVNTATAAILLKVLDVEDQPPEFVSVIPVSRITEDSPVGSSVLQVRAVDGDRGINNSISYSIVATGADSSGERHFHVDSRSGVVYTVQPLDREDPANSNGAYILQILATEDSQLVFPQPRVSTEVTVIVTDENDETPRFRSARYVCEVSENAQRNSPLAFLQDAVPQVFDYDQGRNGTFELYLEGDNGVFDVTPFRGINEASFLIRVRDTEQLDYEKLTVMNFSLVAKETVAKDPKFSVVPITVHIRDENDNFPEFTEAEYRVSVAENVGAGATLAWLAAHDADSGNFGTRGIRYTSLGGSIAHLLHLNPVSGVITVAVADGQDTSSSFDRELVSRHFLSVEARDDLGRGNRNTVQLVLDLLDLNDNAPAFLAPQYEASLVENERHFQFPLVLEARDADLNGTINSQIEYSIVSGEYKDNFTINPDSGVITPVGEMDFEQISGDDKHIRPIYLTVRARDFGSPAMWSDVSVCVYVSDANDHAPAFLQTMYRRSVPEDTPGGTPLLQVQARDGDGSFPNNKVVYRIQKGASDKFVIDSESGVISVARGSLLDPDRTHPKTSRYTLTVLAIDGGIGEQQLQAAVLVNITIIDVNNKPPVLEDPGVITVKENTQVGTLVFRALAHDADEQPILRYHLDRESSLARDEEGAVVRASEYDYLALWELDSLDGSLRLVRALDREKVEVIRLVLVVEDAAAALGGPKQTASATLSIMVEDENDNNPRFRRSFYRHTVMENSQLGVNIAKVEADDADRNRSITYSLEGINEITKLVHLETDTGEVVVARKIDHEQYSWLNLTVKATDSGIPPRSSMVELFIQVLDENDNNPYFEVDSYSTGVRVLEDAQPGSEVAHLQAHDADAGEFGRVTFMLDRASSQGKFLIDADSGVITVADWLDRETQSSYNLIVEAWDNYPLGYRSGESRNTFRQIMVYIEDVNDNSPVLLLPGGAGAECSTVTEFLAQGAAVARVQATDADDPHSGSGRVRLQVVGGNGADLFEIKQTGNDNTGRVLSRHSLKDRFGNYTLLVEATDLGHPPNRVRGEMNVCVTDYNDHAPLFVSPPQNVTIKVPENATIGSTVVKVHAVDADIGPNGAVRYRLQQAASGDWRTFSMQAEGASAGALQLRRSLDREKQKVYELRVEAYDLGIPTPLSSLLDLTIYVASVEQYRPRFLLATFSLNFTEDDSSIGSTVSLPDVIRRDEIDATDELALPVCYYIVSGDPDGHFDLERNSHRLFLAKRLDREIKATHTLLVQASEDCEHAPEYSGEENDSILRVTVYVNDINDNSPTFVSKVFTAGITTEAHFGTEFMHVKASDPDYGDNAKVSYYLVGEVQKTLSEGLENLVVSPFLLDRTSGAVTLNFDPQEGMKGYFDFEVLANDTGGLEDTARVFIYLLRSDQRVRVVLRQAAGELRDRVAEFRAALARVLGGRHAVHVDELRAHRREDGTVDRTKTDLYLHLVDAGDHSVLQVQQVLHLIDSNIEKLDLLFKEFNVLDTQPSSLRAGVSVGGLGGVGGLSGVWCAWLALLLSWLLSGVWCVMQRKAFARRLKAAAATAYVSSTGRPGESDMTIRSAGARVPNTNKHSSKGSNPIWLQAYQNDWYKPDEEQLSSRNSDPDSLDRNVLAEADHEKPYFITDAAFPSLDSDPGFDKQTKYDLYQQIEQIHLNHNTKSLETTEL